MSALLRAWVRVAALWRKRELDAELEAELAAHIELAAEEFVRRGLPEAEARRRARMQFGGMDAAKEAHREARGLAWVEGWLYDLRFAVRGLRRDWGYGATAVVILAAALGLHTAVFAVVNTMLFRGLPLVKDNDRLLYIQERRSLNSCCLLYPDFLAWRAGAQSFEGLAFVAGKGITLSEGNGAARERSATLLTPNAFSLLGVKPRLGRDFREADTQPGAPPVLLLSDAVWREQFGGRPDIVGHQVRINRELASVIGVMPPGFDFPIHNSMWMPLQETAEYRERRPSGYLAFGRLAKGATQATARAELETIARRLEADHPASNKGVRPQADTFSQFFIGPEAAMIYGSLWAAAWVVLLIAGANLANLTLARTWGRSREFATRMALGAGHWRISRQVLLEALLLSAAGGTAAWWLASWAVTKWMEATWTQYVVLDYSMTATLPAYLAASAVGMAVLFTLAPMVRLQRLGTRRLAAEARTATLSRGAKRLSAVLVAGQMALAMVLLMGAGVLARSLWNIVGADVGVTGADRILIGRVSVPPDQLANAELKNAFWDVLRGRLLAIPGVAAESMANTIPAANPGATTFEWDGAVSVAAAKPAVAVVSMGSGYLKLVGARTLAGRDFADTDAPNTPPVAMVNESFVARYWPGENPLGKRVRLYPQGQPGVWRTVVGVASNIMQNQPTRQEFAPIVYVPYRQVPGSTGTVFVRTQAPPAQVAARVRAEIERARPDVTLEDYSTLAATFGFDRDRMDLEHAELGKHAAVAPVFAIAALLLAAIGLYAVMAHSVGQRTQEIGVRMAVGAAVGDIRRMVLREGLWPVWMGLMVGLPASLAVNRVLESQLVAVSPYDPVTFAASVAVLLLVSIVGCRVPARRATRVDPVVALRHD